MKHPDDKSEQPSMGRPPKPIDWDEVNKLLEFHCTGEECAAFLEMSYDALQTRTKLDKSMTFAEYSEIHIGKGNVSLRRTQHKVAVHDENVQMLIHLGKTRLGQKEEIGIDHGNKGGVPFIIDSAPIVHRSLEDDIDDDLAT